MDTFSSYICKTKNNNNKTAFYLIIKQLSKIIYCVALHMQLNCFHKYMTCSKVSLLVQLSLSIPVVKTQRLEVPTVIVTCLLNEDKLFFTSLTYTIGSIVNQYVIISLEAFGT